jgi:hypothetical protein
LKKLQRIESSENAMQIEEGADGSMDLQTCMAKSERQLKGMLQTRL